MNKVGHFLLERCLWNAETMKQMALHRSCQIIFIILTNEYSLGEIFKDKIDVSFLKVLYRDTMVNSHRFSLSYYFYFRCYSIYKYWLKREKVEKSLRICLIFSRCLSYSAPQYDFNWISFSQINVISVLYFFLHFFWLKIKVSICHTDILKCFFFKRDISQYLFVSLSAEFGNLISRHWKDSIYVCQ